MMGYMTTTIDETDILQKLNSRGNSRRWVTFATLRAALQSDALKTPVNAVAATGTVVFSGTPVANDTLTIGGYVFTFKASRAVAGEITINANNTTQGDNLVTALTADVTNVTGVNAAGTVTITAATRGVVGNAITLVEAATGTAVSGAALTGGIDGTVGAEGEVCVDASYLYAAVAANTTADRNWRRISLGAAY